MKGTLNSSSPFFIVSKKYMQVSSFDSHLGRSITTVVQKKSANIDEQSNAIFNKSLAHKTPTFLKDLSK